MEKRVRPGWSGLVCGWGAGAALMAGIAGCGSTASDEPLPGGTILIQHEELFGKLQRPPVAFDHARHVEILEDPDCSDCHEGIAGDEDPYSFVPADVVPGRAAMDGFHDGCLACHEERRAAGSGGEQIQPAVACGDCHQREIEERPIDHADAGWDYVVHAQHVRGLDEKCEECHHVLDEQTKQLVYAKDQEESCQTCHGPVEVDGIPSLRAAAHEQCIQCHLTRRAAQQTAGPTACNACHGEREVPDAATLAALPRLERGQPDTVQITVEGGQLEPVAFDHRAHENRAGFCRDCHHDSTASCGECHTLDGAEKGQWVNAQLAFHDAEAPQSCIGCHNEQKRAGGCVGCHQLMPAELPRGSCAICHVADTVHDLELAESMGAGELDSATAVASVIPAPPSPTTILDEAPESVTIDQLTDEYSAVEYPHRQVYEKLRDTAGASSLAQHFHGSDETLCYGCHHNSPAGQKPPACISCHEQALFDDRRPGRPGLKAAYHLQCMDCHQAMEIEPQACGTGCHTPVKKTAPTSVTDTQAEEGK